MCIVKQQKRENIQNKVVFKHRLTFMFMAPVNKMRCDKRVSKTVLSPPVAYYILPFTNLIQFQFAYVSHQKTFVILQHSLNPITNIWRLLTFWPFVGLN